MTSLYVTVYYREMTNTELLLQHLTPEVAESVIITMQKAIEGVTHSFHIQKLYSTGTTCRFPYTKELDMYRKSRNFRC